MKKYPFIPQAFLSLLMISLDADGYLAEIQHLFRSESFNIITGGGYFNSDEELVTDISLFPPELNNLDT